MNLNHEIIIFQDIDYNNSNLYLRMMLKGKNKIKKYKEIELKIKELSIKKYEKKIINFPFKSKLTLNYTLTNDKKTISTFIKDTKAKRSQKVQKNIFEGGGFDDEEDNMHEESENSDDVEKNEKDDNNNNSNKNTSNTNLNKIENTSNNKVMDFKQRLSIFEKKNQPQKITKNDNSSIKLSQSKTIQEKLKELNLDKNKIDNKKKIDNNTNKNEHLNKIEINKKFENKIIKNEKNEIPKNFENNNNKNKNKNEIVKMFENKTKKIENNTPINDNKINKNELVKKFENSKNEIIKKFETNKKETIKKNENNPHKNEIIKRSENKTNKNEVITKNDTNKQKEFEKNNKMEIYKKSETFIKKEIINKTSIPLDEKDSKKYKLDNNILKTEIINIEDEFTLESFCKCFFICSFPYHKGKIMEDSKNYKSICGHAICCKLLAMEPEIIYKYPLDDPYDLELNNLSASICFPTGIKICYNQERRTIYKTFSTHIINQQGQKYYMTIYHFYRQLEQITYNKLYSDNPLKIYLRQFGENIYKNKAQKEQLEKDLEECQDLGFRDYVYIPYALVLVSKYPYINQMKNCLNIIYKIITNDKEILNNLDENIKSSLINKILAYLIYGIPIPKVNSEISFNVPLYSKNIKIASPYKDNARNLENLNFSYIISKFCPETIIKIYRYMLFEQKLLFIDKDNNRLSTVIDSFINILYPIDWVNTVIPIMSDQMTRYLQTFLPFVNGVSEDLYFNSAKKALDDAEEGVFVIDIIKETIQYSKPNNEDDVVSSIPNLPDEIYKKLYSELIDLSDAYIILSDKENKFSENINNIVKNIFLESTCIMLYELLDYALENQNDFKGFSNDVLFQIFGEDAGFYKELTDTQIFQNFIQNFIQKKKNYSLFISMLKNITEKYVKNKENSKFTWKKTIRKIEPKDIQKISPLFKIPNHLLNEDDKINDTYIIDKKEWKDINKIFEKKDESILSNEIINESDRIALIINNINSDLYPSNKKMERYILPDEKLNYQKAEYRMNNTFIGKSSNLFNKKLALDYERPNEYLKRETDLTKEDQDKIKKNLKDTLTSLLKNDLNVKIDLCLKYLYYEIGRDILCKELYKKGFKVVKKLNQECFMSLNKICINALISINNLEENQNILEFAVKITSSAFCFCQENKDNYFLIDEIRNNFGKDYFMWNKHTFWNTWQYLENYYIINDYNIYCQVIIHDFANKLLRLKIDKDFIINYLVTSLGEKMILLEHSGELDTNKINENKNLFNQNSKYITEMVNNNKY